MMRLKYIFIRKIDGHLFPRFTKRDRNLFYRYR